MTTPLPSSSWIECMLYKSCPDGSTYLAFILKREDRRDEPIALLYGGSIPSPNGPTPPLPSWLPGLVAAGRAGKPVSPGRVYNKLVKGRGYVYTRVVGKEQVRKLEEMMS
jgi:hypothetical protein